jgi:hypothetical protein
MNWHVIVRPPISRAVGQFGLSRSGLVRLLASLHTDLPTHANQVQSLRDPNDPDYCIYRYSFKDGAAWHYFEFRIDDVTAPGYLFVDRVKHTVF